MLLRAISGGTAYKKSVLFFSQLQVLFRESRHWIKQVGPFFIFLNCRCYFGNRDDMLLRAISGIKKTMPTVAKKNQG